jgi:superfamily I DNA/RNA helicase
MTWFVPYEWLDVEQKRAVQLDMQRHRVIFGPPGSGKTIVLLHRAEYLYRSARVPPNGFRIFVYTRVLKAYLKDAVEFLGLPKECISTFDQWCVAYHRQNVSMTLPDEENSAAPDFAAVRVNVLDHLRKNGYSSQFRFVVVDEAQDLDHVAFEILKRISRHVTVCADDKQQLYDSSSSQAAILKELGLHQQNLTLLGAYRCVPFVAELAAELIENPDEKEQFLGAVQAESAEKETPVLYKAQGFEEEKRQVVEILRDRVSMGKPIALIFPSKNLLNDFVNYIEQAGIQIEIAGKTASGMQLPTDFSNSVPKAMLYWSAKGLTFHTVILPRLVEHAFARRVSETRLKRLLFVGITRATNWVYLTTEEGKELPLLRTFSLLEQRGSLKIQRRRTTVLHDAPRHQIMPTDDLTSIL